MGNLTVKQAKETQIFYSKSVNEVYQDRFIGDRKTGRSLVSCDFEVEETNLFDFVMESVDETTSPRGIASRLFYERETSEGYISHLNTKESISVDAFENLTEKEQFSYFFYEEAFVNFRLYTWGVNGNNRKPLGYNFDIQEEAEDFLFGAVYNDDFQGDCNRDTSYFYTKQEAEEMIFERYSENFDVSLETARSIYFKQQKIKARRVELEDLKKSDFLKSEKRSKENMILFISENKELIISKKEELAQLKANGDKTNWQIKANALVQIVSKNDFRCLNWKDIYSLINTSLA